MSTNSDYAKLSSVLVKSKPDNTETYDMFWSDFREEFKAFRVDRLIELIKLIEPNEFLNRCSNNISLDKVWSGLKGKDCLDLCSGSGSYTAAMIESGAKSVTMADGSFKSLDDFERKINLAENLTVDKHEFVNKVSRVQVNANTVLDHFQKESFDVVFIRYAIHHLENPFQTILDLSKLLRPGGVLAFNYFRLGTTDPCRRMLRGFFKQYSAKNVFEILSLIGRIPSVKGKYTLIQLVDNDISNLEFAEKIKPIVKFLRNVSMLFGIDEVERRLSFEDFTTSYIHNLNRRETLEFCKNIGLDTDSNGGLIFPTSTALSCIKNGPISDIDLPVRGFNTNTSEYMTDLQYVSSYLKDFVL